MRHDASFRAGFISRQTSANELSGPDPEETRRNRMRRIVITGFAGRFAFFLKGR